MSKSRGRRHRKKAYKKVPGFCPYRAMASANKRSCHRFISFAMFPVTEQSPNTPRMQDCLLLSGSLLSRLYAGGPGFVNDQNALFPGGKRVFVQKNIAAGKKKPLKKFTFLFRYDIVHIVRIRQKQNKKQTPGTGRHRPRAEAPDLRTESAAPGGRRRRNC